VVLVSALTGEGLPELLQVLEDEVPHPDTLVHVLLPYNEGGLVSRIHGEGEILVEEHTGDGTRLEARVGPSLAAELGDYLVASA
jgi:GTP-binding protein HflX